MEVPPLLQSWGITAPLWVNALEEHRLVPLPEAGPRSFRVARNVGNLPRGSLITPEGIIPAYPSIARVFHLVHGIQHNFHAPFAVEEKVDGYNVRVAVVDGRILAISRGGFICPFTSDRLPDLLPADDFFAAHPDLVLCMEVAGPDNPYNTGAPPYVPRDVRGFAFDLMDRRGRLLPPEKRNGYLDRLGVPTVRRFGRGDPDHASSVRATVADLEREGCEGIVMKSLDGQGRAIKYVTPSSNLRDMCSSAERLDQIGQGYFVQRMLRYILSRREFDLPLDREAYARLGEAMGAGVARAAERVEQGLPVVEHHRIRVHGQEVADALFEQLAHAGVPVHETDSHWEDGLLVVSFTKEAQRATGAMQRRLMGTPVVD